MRADFIISFVFLVVLALCVNPGEHLWMPSMGQELLVAALTVVFAVYVIFFLREKSADEREDLHRLFAGRVAFLVGAAVLTVGIAYQSYHHALDAWLPLALGGMVLSKMLARLWKEKQG
jgi:ABC-type Co2+ transport system permease subunit